MVNVDSEVYSEVNGARAVVRGPLLQDGSQARKPHLLRTGTSRLLDTLVICSEDAGLK